MIPKLTDHEVRVLGCLMEKSVVTPEQYPLTLNALMLACNQKSSRDPMLNLTPVQTQHAARDLEAKLLLKREENFRSGIEKFQQRFCNTAFSSVQLSAQQFGALCLLLLRGAQTPGEIRSRAGRLCSFDTNEEAAAVLQSLIDREGGPLVARLPRRPGRQDHEYTHLLAGEIESAPVDAVARTGAVSVDRGDRADRGDRIAQLEARVAALEAALDALRADLGDH